MNVDDGQIIELTADDLKKTARELFAEGLMEVPKEYVNLSRYARLTMNRDARIKAVKAARRKAKAARKARRRNRETR